MAGLSACHRRTGAEPRAATSACSGSGGRSCSQPWKAMHSSRTYRDGRRLITTASAVHCRMLSRAVVLWGAPRRVPGGFGCDAAATRRRASGGDLVGNPANAQHEALTVDCDLHHTPVARSATTTVTRPEWIPIGRRTTTTRAGILRITWPCSRSGDHAVRRRPRHLRLVINSRHNPRYR